MLIAKPEEVSWNECGTYFKFPGGTLINIMEVQLESNETMKVIYFPKSFNNRGYSVVVTNIYSYSTDTIWTITKDADNYMAVYPVGNETAKRNATIIAIGTWK